MKKRFQKSLLHWSQNHLRNFPWRKKNISPYKIFVAEMLLKRTTAKAASNIFPQLIKKYPTVSKLANANKRELAKLIAPIGYPQRALEMIKVSKVVLKKFNGHFPTEKNSLTLIPFIGDYTSSAILSLAYDKPLPMVDSNVNRIINRAFLGKNPPLHITKKIKEIAIGVLPKSKHRIFNLAMLDIGGTICLPKVPKCIECPFSKFCEFNN